MSSLLLVHGESEIMSEEESIQLFERCPGILHFNIDNVNKKLVHIFAKTALYYLPWNLIILGIVVKFKNVIDI